MGDSNNLTEQQMVFLDPFLLDRARIQAGLSLGDLANKSDLNYRTVKKGVFLQGGLLPSNAKALADTLGCDVLELLAPWDPRYVLPKSATPWLGESEWERVPSQVQSRQAANGLYYIFCPMRHRHTAGRRGRGKFYWLSGIRHEQQAEMRHKLTRHADVCVRIARHPHVALNLSSSPTATDDGWWIVDEWVGADTLADRLESGPWPLDQLPGLLHDVALGLAALHAAGVIFRELAPSHVLIAEQDSRAVLTDFELAKLLDGVPSVSHEWPDDPFRAPEITGRDVTIAADLYSFGRLAATAIAGTVPERGNEEVVFLSAGMPKRLLKLLNQSVAGFPNQRPQELDSLLKELSRWAGR